MKIFFFTLDVFNTTLVSLVRDLSFDEIHELESDWMDCKYGQRAPKKIFAVCRYLDQKLDWVMHWDPSGARARAPTMNRDALWRVDYKRWCVVEKEPYCSRSLFFHVWSRYYDHIYLTDLFKYRQCKLCKNCNLEMKKACEKDDLLMKQAVFLLKLVHLEHIRNLRRNVKSFEKIAAANSDFIKMLILIFWVENKMLWKR